MQREIIEREREREQRIREPSASRASQPGRLPSQHWRGSLPGASDSAGPALAGLSASRPEDGRLPCQKDVGFGGSDPIQPLDSAGWTPSTDTGLSTTCPKDPSRLNS